MGKFLSENTGVQNDKMTENFFMKKLTMMLQRKLDEQLQKGFKAFEYSFVYQPKESSFNTPVKYYKVVVFDPERYKMVIKDD